MFWNKKGVYPNNMFFQTKLFGQKKKICLKRTKT